MGAATALKPSQPASANLTPNQPSPATAALGGQQATGDQTTQAIEQHISDDEAARGAMTPPKMDDLPKMPEPKNTNPLQIWGSAAMAMAAIGSLFTRQPLTTALNSAAGVMKAYKKGDMEAANAEFERWKVSSDNAIKIHNFQMELYKADLEKVSTDERLALASLRAHAESVKDTVMAKLAGERNLIAIAHLNLDRQKHADALELQGPKLEQVHLFHQQLDVLKKSPDWAKASPADRAGMVAGIIPGGMMPQAQIDYFGKLYNLTGKMPPMGLGNTPLRGEILSSAARQAAQANMTPAQVVAMQGKVKANQFALSQLVKQTGLIEGFEKTALANGQLALSLMDKGLGPTGRPVLDSWLRGAAVGLGNPEYSQFDTAVKTFKNEYSKIMSGAFGSSGSTDASRREADELIRPGLSRQQFVANMNVMKQEMSNRLKGNYDAQTALMSDIANADQPGQQGAVGGNTKSVPGELDFNSLTGDNDDTSDPNE